MSSTTIAEAIAFPPLEEVPAVPSIVLDVTCMRLLNIWSSARSTEEWKFRFVSLY